MSMIEPISEVPSVPERAQAEARAGESDPSFLATHRMSLEDAPRGYQLFKAKQDGCVRAVFTPAPAASA
ncbi:uncharacterized protein SOCEGT47_000460 [Sorangium cellulosum]|uniref:Uncharacterized protein n=1 Tax=Sorangium cellulosum TaxID=56 RepID=A0A4P2PSS5_SORCE|nr:hypothetical protein [Sorangium cellulosum]AUX19594.1 uncharacterized protein SOCEGT47_000460 [Sorangium cellulosum]